MSWPRCSTHLIGVVTGPELARRAVAPGLPALHREAKPLWCTGPDLRASKEGVRNAKVESFRLMILDMFAPIVRRWPRDGAALLAAPSHSGRCVEQPAPALRSCLATGQTHYRSIYCSGGLPERSEESRSHELGSFRGETLTCRPGTLPGRGEGTTGGKSSRPTKECRNRWDLREVSGYSSGATQSGIPRSLSCFS